MARRSLVLACLVACLAACAGMEGRRAIEPAPKAETWLSQIPTTLVGRVSLDGAPIRSFGIGVIRPERGYVSFPFSARQLLFAPPHAIRTVDGRFSLPLMPGVVDLVVSGRGFARTILRGVDVRHGIRSPLEIAVERGQRLAGVVRDAAGQPIGGARVAIEQTGALTGNTLHDLANGNYAFTTRADGSFEIEGFVDVSNKLTAVVRRDPDGSLVATSHPFRLPLGIDLTLFPIGALRGQVAGSMSPSEVVTVSARSSTHPAARYTAEVDARGAFRFAALPAGKYVVAVSRTRGFDCVGLGKCSRLPVPGHDDVHTELGKIIVKPQIETVLPFL